MKTSFDIFPEEKYLLSHSDALWFSIKKWISYGRVVVYDFLNVVVEDEFYTRMQKYILTKEELEGNGYPRSSRIPGRAEITECYSKLKRNVTDRKYDLI